MSRALFAAFVLLAEAGVSHGEGAKTDLYGDPLPPGAVARLGTVRLRHASAEIAFSKDSKQLISCDCGGDVRFWDVVTGKRLRENRLSQPTDAKALDLAALSPDGTMAAAWDGEAMYVYDVDTGRKRGRMPSIALGLSEAFVKFSPSSTLLAIQTPPRGESQFTTQIWDVRKVKKRQTLKNPSGIALSSIAFSWDDRRLAGIVPHGDAAKKLSRVPVDLLLWDVTTGEPICRSENIQHLGLFSLAFSPDGKTLAAVGDSKPEIRLFDPITLKEKSRLNQSAKSSFHLLGSPTFSPDGRWLAAVAIRFSPVPGVTLNEVSIWDLGRGEESRRLPARSGTRLVFAPDSKTLACHDESGGAIRLWDVVTGRPLHQRIGHDVAVDALAASLDGKLLASGDSVGVLCLWDAATGKHLRVLEHEDLSITSCLFSRDGKQLISVSERCSFTLPRGRIQLWEVATGKLVRGFEINEGHFLTHAVTISADGKRLAAVVSLGANTSSTQLVVWDLATGRRLSQRPYRYEALSVGTFFYPEAAYVRFAPDGESVGVWLGDRAGLEEVSTGSLLATLPKGVGQRGRPLVFSPDGRLVAVSRQTEEGTSLLSLIETASGEEVMNLELEQFRAVAFAFTLDGSGMIVVDGKHLSVRDTETGNLLHKLALPESIWDLPGVVALPGGRVATAMNEDNILVWDLAPETWRLRKPVGDHGRKGIDALWADLASDARKAHRALAAMAAAPAQAVRFLRDHLHPAALDVKRVEKLLADLDGDSFEAREAATRELARQLYQVEPALRRVLDDKSSLEMRRRLQAILAGPKRPTAEDLRTLRAIAVLERIGTLEARQMLEKLADGAEVRETQEARIALERLKRLSN